MERARTQEKEEKKTPGSNLYRSIVKKRLRQNKVSRPRHISSVVTQKKGGPVKLSIKQMAASRERHCLTPIPSDAYEAGLAREAKRKNQVMTARRQIV